MSDTISLIPPADLTVAGLGDVYAGQPVDVPRAMAGVATDPRREPAMHELKAAIEAIDHEAAQALRDEIAGLEAGYGLLAQGWALAAPAKSAPATEATAAASAAPATTRRGAAAAAPKEK